MACFCAPVHYFLRHEREAFVKFIKGLREGKDARVACQAAFGETPETVDRTWREAVSRRR